MSRSPTSAQVRSTTRDLAETPIAAPRVPVDPEPLDDQFRQLFELTPEQRFAAMVRGELTYPQLCKWAAHLPEEVPLINNEFCFIAAFLPDHADHDRPRSG